MPKYRPSAQGMTTIRGLWYPVGTDQSFFSGKLLKWVSHNSSATLTVWEVDPNCWNVTPVPLICTALDPRQHLVPQHRQKTCWVIWVRFGMKMRGALWPIDVTSSAPPPMLAFASQRLSEPPEQGSPYRCPRLHRSEHCLPPGRWRVSHRSKRKEAARAIIASAICHTSCVKTSPVLLPTFNRLPHYRASGRHITLS